MKKLLVALCLTLATGVAFAKEEKAATPQQTKMADCNKEAKAQALKGAERKAFMKTCLGNKPAAAAEPKKEPTAQQQKMKNCNKEAKEKALKGADRKSFMSGCLKGDAKPTEAKQ